MRAAGILLLCLTVASPTSGQGFSPCSAGLISDAGLPKLNCIELIPVASASSATAFIEMSRPESAFTVSVTKDGRHRRILSLTATDLPMPKEFGEYETYVAWLTNPTFSLSRKLGVVENGTVELGEVNLNKFTILVTAEPSANVSRRSGPLVLRGRSPSSLLEPHDVMQLAPVALLSLATGDTTHSHTHGDSQHGWTMPPPSPYVPMLPGMKGLLPDARPYMLDAAVDDLPWVRPSRWIEMADGDTLTLTAQHVRRSLNGRDIPMLGFNGQHPGPLINVKQASKAYINFVNATDLPTTVHWHGLRLDNRFDGVPGLTQDPVQPGESFLYEVIFPDAGLYWYHPHQREDILQELGLYGNMLVESSTPGYFSQVHREEVLILDDLALSSDGIVAFGRDAANYALMGRFGNTLLVNGEPEYNLDVQSGEVVRFYLTNVSNTRTFNLSFGSNPIKVVASDLSKYEREMWEESVVIAPAERMIVEVQFAEAGSSKLENTVHGLIHMTGRFFLQRDSLGTIRVGNEVAHPDLTPSFRELRTNLDVSEDIDSFRDLFDRAPDKELVLSLRVDSLPAVVQQMMRLDPIYFNPVEWTGTMPMMNWQTTSNQVEWILRDVESGDENMDIEWNFDIGETVKIRIHNDRDAFHAMQHPIHLHGQRFLVVAQDGRRNPNLVWKDTVMLPVGSTIDILLHNTNPGDWMLHCHIAEHLETGMMMTFRVGTTNSGN